MSIINSADAITNSINGKPTLDVSTSLTATLINDKIVTASQDGLYKVCIDLVDDRSKSEIMIKQSDDSLISLSDLTAYIIELEYRCVPHQFNSSKTKLSIAWG